MLKGKVILWKNRLSKMGDEKKKPLEKPVVLTNSIKNKP